MRFGVVGSREFKNYAQLEEKLNSILGYEDEIVSGGAIGADTFAERFAREHELISTRIPPKYKTYGTSAPFIRNGIIAARSDIVIAFYQKGRFGVGGTADTVRKARKLNKEVVEIEEI